MKDCIFCKIIKNEIKANIVYKNDNFISFKDMNPKTKGHSLVISKKHYNNILDLPISLGNELIDCIKNTTFKLMKEKEFPGFNMIQNNFSAAGQIVDHFHFHIIPRQNNDNVKLII